jgi:excisionase family DNA binding protein
MRSSKWADGEKCDEATDRGTRAPRMRHAPTGSAENPRIGLMSKETQAWMTAAEAAEYLRISARTLLVWVRAGHVKGYPLHGTKRRVWRFRREDLDAVMGFTSSDVVASPASSGVQQ